MLGQFGLTSRMDTVDARTPSRRRPRPERENHPETEEPAFRGSRAVREFPIDSIAASSSSLPHGCRPTLYGNTLCIAIDV